MRLRDQGPVVAALVFAALGLGGVLLWQLRVELVVLFASFLFGTALYTLSMWLSGRTGMSRKTAVVTIYLVGLVVSVGLVVMGGRRVSSQYGSLGERIPAALEELEARLEGKPLLGTLGQEVADWRERMMDDGNGGGARTEAEEQEADSQRSRLVRLTFAGLSHFLIWAVLSFYIAYDAERYARGAVRLVPPDHRAAADDLIRALRVALPWWLVARLASMAVVTLLTAPGLLLLGVPLAITLALIAGLFSFVPFLGPIAALVPAALVALEAAPQQVLWVFVLYGAVQLLESYVITPRIEDHVVSVPPLVLIASQVIMGVLVGIVGVMFATPLVLTLMIALQILYLKHGLGEHVSPPRQAEAAA